VVRVTNQLNEKILRGLFVTLYWRRQFLARRRAGASYAGDGAQVSKIGLILVPSIVVELSDPAQATASRPPLPSLDLTQMRDDMGSEYPSSPQAPGERDHQLRPRISIYSPKSDAEEESSSPSKRWSNIGAPDSQMANTSTSPLYTCLMRCADIRSPTIDVAQASQIIQSLSTSAWGGAIRSRSRPSTADSDQSGGSKSDGKK
jgi:hypothetical protein